MTDAIGSGAGPETVSVMPSVDALSGTSAFVASSHAFFGVPPHDGSASVPLAGQSNTWTYSRSPFFVARPKASCAVNGLAVVP
jgi:hypothetical protein